MHYCFSLHNVIFLYYYTIIQGKCNSISFNYPYFIYYITVNYEVARRKLKEAEQLSDLNTDTEKEENHKKTRKIRAAKILNTSSSDQEVSDDDFTVDMPRLPDTKKIKNSKNYTKGNKKEKALLEIRKVIT